MAFSSKAAARWMTTASVVAVAAIMTAAPASAQFDRDRNVSVRERPQPGFDPTGIEVGAFRAYFTLPVGVTYNNNIFAAPDEPEPGAPLKVDDIIVTARPGAELRSQWSNHAVGLFADADFLSYQDFGEEDRTDFRAGGNARLDIERNFFITADGSQGWLTESRTDASSETDSLEPIEFRQTLGALNVSKAFNFLRISGGAAYGKLDYDDTIGGTSPEQDDRDHDSITYSGRLEYAVTPTTSVFGAVSASERTYDLQPPVVGITRDSEGLTYSVGTSFDITNLIRGEISVGSMTEDFADPLAEDIDGFSGSASVEWFPTPLATFQLVAERAVTETGVDGAFGALTTTLLARVDYEARRNIIVSGQVSHRDDDYEGILREDTGLAAAVDVLYLINEHVGATLTVLHAERDSEGAQQGYDFDQESVGLNLVLRY